MAARPNAKEVKWLVSAGKSLKANMSTFDNEEAAIAYKKSADAWYGPYHPLTPFSVESVEHNAPLWPTTSDGGNIFDNIDE